MKYLTPSQLMEGCKCMRAGVLASLHLSDGDTDLLEQRKAVKAQLVSLLAGKSFVDAAAGWDHFMEKTYPSLPGVISAGSGEILRQKGLRLIKWFFENGYRMQTAGPIDNSFILNGCEIRSVTDMIVKAPNGKTIHACIRFGRNPYSDAARKEETMTRYAVGLLCMMMSARFTGADCMELYLSGKNDTSHKTEEAFEGRRGWNISYMPFNANCEEDLKHALKIKRPRNCERCGRRRLCSTRELYDESADVPKKPSSGKKGSLASPVQMSAITHMDGPMAVLAVAGAGKTRVLTERFLELVNHKVPVEEILFVTFTRKACEEIRHRVGAVTSRHDKPQIFTFHALATAILRDFGNGMEGQLATKTRRLEMIEQAVKSLAEPLAGVSYEAPFAKFTGLYHKLDSLFENAKGPESFTETSDPGGFARAFDIYSKMYEEGRFFSYDDLIREALRLLDDPDVLRKAQERWTYFMADEFQDVSPDQAELLYRLSSLHNNLVVVGDDDQSIYGWRGGTPEYMLQFSDCFPGARIVFMEDNYRSTREIVDSAQSLIAHNNDAGRYRKVARSASGEEGTPPVFLDSMNVDGLLSYVGGLGGEPSEIAILARKNSTLNKIADAMEQRGMRCLPARKYLLDTEGFGALHCLLKYALHGEETPSEFLYRLLVYAGVRVDAGKCDRLFESYFEDREVLPENIDGAVGVLLMDASLRERLEGAFRILARFDEVPVSVKTFCDRVEEDQCVSMADVLDLMDKMVRYDDDVEVEQGAKLGYYNLLTSHKSKGRQYPTVIVYGIEDFKAEPEDINLMYVSMTRAEKLLVLIQASEAERAPLISMIETIDSAAATRSA